MSDKTADMLTQIRNAQAISLEKIEVPFSNLKYEIAKILAKQGFVKNVDKKGRGIKKVIEIELKYREKDEKPAITGLRKISKPGRRIYRPAKKIGKVRGGHGMSIISTPKGLKTGEQARREKLGGEVICEIW